MSLLPGSETILRLQISRPPDGRINTYKYKITIHTCIHTLLARHHGAFQSQFKIFMTKYKTTIKEDKASGLIKTVIKKFLPK